MKILRNHYFTLFLLAFALGACQDIDELQENPAAVYSPNPQLIFTGSLLSIQESPWNADQRNNQFMVINESFYGSRRSDGYQSYHQ